MGSMFGHLLDTVAGAMGSDDTKPQFVIDADSFAVGADSMATGAVIAEGLSHRHHDDAEEITNLDDDHVPTIPEAYGIAHPLAVFITPTYRNEPISNAMLGELGMMQAIAELRNPDGTQAIEVARWIPDGPSDLEGRLVAIDPLAGTRADIEDDSKTKRELHIRTDIDRVVTVVVRFPISEAQFAQIQTVFCTYGRPRLVADFSNAGLYMDMRMGPNDRERQSLVGSAITRPYSLKVLSQFDVIRVPTQRLADLIERELENVS